jgi:hypothetical protein
MNYIYEVRDEVYFMNIKNFEAIIRPAIIDRGYEIYEQYRWSNFNSNPPYFSMEINGITVVKVQAEIDKQGQLISHECTCNEQHELYCKHLAALLFVVNDEFELIQYNESKKIDKHELEKLSKEQLIDLISTLAKEHHPMYELLRLYVGSKEERLQWAQSLCQANLNFIFEDEFDYEMPFEDFNFDGIFNVLKAAENEDLLDLAVEIALIPLYEILEQDKEENEETYEVLMDMMSHVEASLMLIINEKVDHATVQQKQDAFEHIITIAQQYFEELIEANLFYLFNSIIQLADETNHQEVESFLAFIIQTCQNQEHRFLDEQVLHSTTIFYYNYLIKFGTDEQQNAYLQKHKDNKGLIRIAHESLMKREQYQEALDLVIEALEQKDFHDFLFLKELELETRVKLGHIHDVLEILKGFIFIGDLSYIDHYLTYFDDKNKGHAIDELIMMMKEANISGEQFENLLIETKRYDELMTYSINDPKTILRTHLYLPTQYKEQVKACFEQFIQEAAESSKNKKQYRDIVKYFKEYINYSIDDAYEFIQKIMQQYKNRKAFIEVISKSFGTI